MSRNTITDAPPVELLQRYCDIRSLTDRLTAVLSPEDCTVQSMPDVSPTRWHLAHTTWFFETFLLSSQPGYKPYDASYAELYNSYYNSFGKPFPRDRRGLISRPGLDEVRQYRRHVDQQMHELLSTTDEALRARLAPIVELGLQHEQQHQELILTDIKHVLSCNPLLPAYAQSEPTAPHAKTQPIQWHDFDEGIDSVGHEGPGFAFDNESPRHRRYFQQASLADRLVTGGEYLEFINDGGYRRHDLWLSLGWERVTREQWQAPLYWRQRDGAWFVFTLCGEHPLDPSEPVCHVSYFEADAYARWAGCRLPTEAEWERAAAALPVAGNFIESGKLHPMPAGGATGMRQMFGDVWEWTASAYDAYPGYRPPKGAIGEYNGKFMCNQYVLRGGSAVSSRSHLRATYRNFFPPEARWQFTGIRLAR